MDATQQAALAWMEAAVLIQRWQDAARRTVRLEQMQKKTAELVRQPSQGKR